MAGFFILVGLLFSNHSMTSFCLSSSNELYKLAIEINLSVSPIVSLICCVGVNFVELFDEVKSDLSPCLDCILPLK